ncbi:MAG: hemolysin III family protein [Chloroflexi bacterium]|nr:hemolysin III family protein [Chloroflexota bacterium]
MTRLKDPVAGLTHLAATFVAIAGTVALWLIAQGDLAKQLSLLVYGLSLIALYAASSAYHLIRTSEARTAALRKFDHAAIFALIAGSFTPPCFNLLTGAWRAGVLGGIWAIALAGITFKIATIQTHRWINVAIYLLMGWFGIVPTIKLFGTLPLTAFSWLLLEALFFTVGAVIYGTKRLNLLPGVFGFHELWHLFVIGGTVSHFMLVLLYVVPYVRVT